MHQRVAQPQHQRLALSPRRVRGLGQHHVHGTQRHAYQLRLVPRDLLADVEAPLLLPMLPEQCVLLLLERVHVQRAQRRRHEVHHRRDARHVHHHSQRQRAPADQHVATRLQRRQLHLHL